MSSYKLGPDRFRSGGIWAGSGPVEFGPVPVDFASTRPVPGQERVFKIAMRTDESMYSLNSENVEMLLFMKYKLRYLNFRY